MAILNTILEEEVIPHQAAIHDVQSSTGAVTISPGDGWVEYINDGLNYNFYNDHKMFDTVTGLITDSILNSKIDIILTSTCNFAANVDYLEVKLGIQDTSNTIIATHTIPPIKQGNDVDITLIWGAYNGSYMSNYGAKIFTRVVGGDVVISGRRALIRV